jgi:hypothetical protein
VPALFPRLTPYNQGEQWPFSIDRLVFSKEYKSGLWITVLIIIFYLKTHLVHEHKTMTERIWGLVFIASLLIMIDVFYEMNKNKKRILNKEN